MVPFANYFLSSQWESEMNCNNPLGTGGRLARVFARLIKDMWSGNEQSIAPSDVKRAVGQVRIVSKFRHFGCTIAVPRIFLREIHRIAVAHYCVLY